jgi:hypothetical protein
MMVLDASAHEITRVAPLAYFRQVVARNGQSHMTEFDWACFYTKDTLNMLIQQVKNEETLIDIARSLEAQAILWEMCVPFPKSLSGARCYHDDWPIAEPRQIPSASVLAIPSRIPQSVRDIPPEDTYYTYNPQFPLPPWANR